MKSESVLRSIIYLASMMGAFSVLDISPSAAEDIVDNLRSHIFVESRHVSAQETGVCDSLSGPFCESSPSLTASGVIPSEYIGSLQINFDVLHHALPLDLWKYNYTSVLTENYALPPPSSLVLKDLPNGGKITSHYSMSLPTGSGLAKLEGRWLLEDSVSMETFLPAYVKFSEPVLVKHLWAELTLASDLDGKIKPSVIVAFRLGTETVWTTEAIMDHGLTMDVTSRGADGHGPLRACDQIVIFSTVRGLKIVSIDFEHAQDQVLVPTLLLVPGREGTLMFKNEMIDTRAIASGKVVSIKEAISKGYQLQFPERKQQDKSKALAELIAKDIGVIAPVDDVVRAVKNGDIHLPHELKKAILKHEAEMKELAKSMAKKALEAVVALGKSEKEPEAESPSLKDKRLQAISDLFIAAVMHL